MPESGDTPSCCDTARRIGFIRFVVGDIVESHWSFRLVGDGTVYVTIHYCPFCGAVLDKGEEDVDNK